MSTQVLLCKLRSPHKQCSGTKSQASTTIQNFGRRRLPVISDHSRRKKQLLVRRTGTSFTMDKSYRWISKIETDVITAAQVRPEPGLPVPPDPSSNSWNLWVVGMLLSTVLSFSNKFGPLLKLKREVERTIDAAEMVAEVVEEMGEKVGEVAEDVAEQLPEGWKLKKAVTFVEKVAKGTAKGAQLADDILEKVEKVGEDMDSFFGVGPNKDPSPQTEITKAAKDQ